MQSEQSKGGKFGVKEELKSSNTVGSVDKADQNVGEYAKKSHPAKKTTNPFQAKRKGVLNEITSSGPGGSLATLWGRASVKSKPSSMVPHSTSNVANAGCKSKLSQIFFVFFDFNLITIVIFYFSNDLWLEYLSDDADAQIHAEEASDVMSSDDEGYGVSYKREPNDFGTRKRQYIINYSDEEDEDNVVSLASPNPPNEKSFSDSLPSTKSLCVEKEKANNDKLKAETLVNEQENNEKNYGLSSDKSGMAEVSLLKAENNSHNELSKTNERDNASMAPKRKKLVKTRIDERGREGMSILLPFGLTQSLSFGLLIVERSQSVGIKSYGSTWTKENCRIASHGSLK